MSQHRFTYEEMTYIVMEVVSQLNDGTYLKTNDKFCTTADLIPDLNTISLWYLHRSWELDDLDEHVLFSNSETDEAFDEWYKALPVEP